MPRSCSCCISESTASSSSSSVATSSLKAVRSTQPSSSPSSTSVVTSGVLTLSPFPGGPRFTRTGSETWTNVDQLRCAEYVRPRGRDKPPAGGVDERPLHAADADASLRHRLPRRRDPRVHPRGHHALRRPELRRERLRLEAARHLPG